MDHSAVQLNEQKNKKEEKKVVTTTEYLTGFTIFGSMNWNNLAIPECKSSGETEIMSLCV